jgi:hypothetical protein
MKKLPKDKRNKVLLVWLGTACLIAGWAFMILTWQLGAKSLAKKNLDDREKLYAEMTMEMKNAELIERKRAESEQQLLALEAGMAAGDVYSWALDTLQKFKQKYPAIEMPQFSPITQTDCTLLPKFPYQQASLTVAGSAYYWDLGMFIADFENQFRYARIAEFELQPVGAGNAGDREKLSFRMEIIFLVKPKNY